MTHTAFQLPVEEVHDGRRPVITLAAGEEVPCDFVLGCDGFRGVTRAAVKGASCSGFDFGAQWLALPAEVPPAGDHTVYGLRPAGFAGHMLRSATVSRFYLQIAPRSDPESWADQLIWDQLQQLLAADGIDLTPGPIIERGILELHSYVTEPMQSGRVLLAGDAAHIVTPVGGKA
jgi:p-hydroxybenzoate 3-monooxygenase